MNVRAELKVGDKTIHLVFGHTLREWKRIFSTDNLWDFILDELVNGAITPNEDMWYWYIDGRCYETNEEV